MNKNTELDKALQSLTKQIIKLVHFGGQGTPHPKLVGAKILTHYNLMLLPLANSLTLYLLSIRST